MSDPREYEEYNDFGMPLIIVLKTIISINFHVKYDISKMVNVFALLHQFGVKHVNPK